MNCSRDLNFLDFETSQVVVKMSHPTHMAKGINPNWTSNADNR
jgi:hypothetical protein